MREKCKTTAQSKFISQDEYEPTEKQTNYINQDDYNPSSNNTRSISCNARTLTQEVMLACMDTTKNRQRQGN